MTADALGNSDHCFVRVLCIVIFVSVMHDALSDDQMSVSLRALRTARTSVWVSVSV